MRAKDDRTPRHARFYHVATSGTGRAARPGRKVWEVRRVSTRGPGGRMKCPRPASAVPIHRHSTPGVSFCTSGKRRSLGVAGRWTMTDSRKEVTLDTEDSVGTQAPTHAYREGLCNSLQARGRGEHRGGGRPGPAQITRTATQVTGLLFPFEANIQAYPLNFTAHKIPVLRLSNKPPAASPPGGGTRGPWAGPATPHGPLPSLKSSERTTYVFPQSGVPPKHPRDVLTAQHKS